jgi:hypothetical protein
MWSVTLIDRGCEVTVLVPGATRAAARAAALELHPWATKVLYIERES